MIIDLSSYYKDDLAPKLEQIKQAIKESKCITFHYCYNKGEADKQIEPYLIVFKWSDWYVFGFCKERQDFRPVVLFVMVKHYTPFKVLFTHDFVQNFFPPSLSFNRWALLFLSCHFPPPIGASPTRDNDTHVQIPYM